MKKYFSLLALVCAYLNPNSAHATEALKLPCSDSAPGHGILKSCKALRTEIKTGVLGPNGEVTLMRENIRLGKSPDGSSTVKSTPLCDPANPGDMNTDSSPCGTWVKFERNGFGVKTVFQSSSDRQREYNHLGGTMLSMIDHHGAAVMDELDTGQLQISSGCEGAARRIQETKTGLLATLTDHKNSDDIINCKKTTTEATDDTVTDVGGHRMSARLLCAAQANIEAATAHVVSCEIMRRSELAYHKLFEATPPNMEDFVKSLSKKVERICLDKCKVRDGRSCGKNCSNTNYPIEFMRLYREKVRQNFPKAKVSQVTLPGLSPKLPLGSSQHAPPVLAGVGSPFLAAFLFFSLLPSLLLTGCGGGSGAAACPTGNSPPCQAPAIDAGGCCIPDPNSGGDGGGSAAALDRAASAILSAEDLFAGSNRLLSKTKGAALDGVNLTSASATAGGEGMLAPSAQKAPGAAGAGNGGSSDNSAGNNGGGSSLGGTGGGGTALAHANGTSDAAPQLLDGGEMRTGAGNTTGGGGTGDGESDMGRLYSGGNSGSATAGVGVDFNSEASGGEAISSADPADYFTRINIEENLFKRVETRYTQKNRTWLTQEVRR